MHDLHVNIRIRKKKDIHTRSQEDNIKIDIFMCGKTLKGISNDSIKPLKITIYHNLFFHLNKTFFLNKRLENSTLSLSSSFEKTSKISTLVDFINFGFYLYY